MRISDEHDWAVEIANQRALRHFAWLFGSGLAVALAFPTVLFAATLSSLLGLGAGIMATIALLTHDEPFANSFTRWDVAAGLYALSLFVGFFVDLDAVRFFMLTEGMAAG